MPKITPHLWYDKEAEEAANYYVSVFPNSTIVQVTRYGEAGQEVHGQAPGTVMTVAFELDGQPFTALNGGPIFTFNESVSFVIDCKDQEEVDYYWEKLSAVPESEQCGWLKDKYGVSWQVVPRQLGELMADADTEAANRVMEAMLKMHKLDIAALQAAHDNKG